MVDSQQDIELFAVLTSHDSARFTPIIDRLGKEAYRIAKAEGYDADAAEKAIQKVTDWLGSDAPFSVEYPWAYAEKIMYYAILDYGKTHTGEKQIRLSEGDTEMLVTQVEGVSWDEGERNRRAESLGYRITKLKPTEYIEGRYIKAFKRQLEEEGVVFPKLHHWLLILDGLRGRWFVGDEYDIHLARRYLLDKYRGTGTKINDRAVSAFIKQGRDWRWLQYKLIKGSIDKIPGFVERGIMEHYLRGYSRKDLEAELDDSKQYVSKVTRKWLKEWGWDKRREVEAMIILLTHCLANIWRKRERRYCQKLSRFKTALRLEYLDDSDFRGAFSSQAKKCLEELDDMGSLYSMVKTSPEAKKHFSDLNKSGENLALLGSVTRQCEKWWYNCGLYQECNRAIWKEINIKIYGFDWDDIDWEENWEEDWEKESR